MSYQPYFPMNDSWFQSIHFDDTTDYILEVTLIGTEVCFRRLGLCETPADCQRIVITFPELDPCAGKEEVLHRLTALSSEFDLKFLYRYGERIYLRKDRIRDQHVLQNLKEIDWLRDEHRMEMGSFGDNIAVAFSSKSTSIENYLKTRTFPIEALGDGDVPIIGTCFAVEVSSKIILLTAKHVMTRIHDLFETKYLGYQVKTSSGVFKVEMGKPFENCDVCSLNFQDPNVVENLEYFRVGKDDLCEIMDPIYYCGYPNIEADTPTVSVGHISGLGALYREESGLMQLTGLAINPNCSGGPIINSDREVIGVLTTRGERSRNHENVSFAVPFSQFNGIIRDVLDPN